MARRLKEFFRLLWSAYLFLHRFYCEHCLSDRAFVRRAYRIVFGRELDLAHPSTLNEKIQWLKLYDRRRSYTVIADKFAARDYVARRIGAEHLVPLVFHTDDPEAIGPEVISGFPVIIKPNNSSGRHRIIRDRANVDWKDVRKECGRWLAENYYRKTKEWQYKDVRPLLLVERLLLDEAGRIPDDYKFECFHGRVEFIYVVLDRLGAHKLNIYSREWERLPFMWAPKGEDAASLKGREIDPPPNLDRMIALAETLSADFPFIRVDLYYIGKAIYFSELTLHHGSGMHVFSPGAWDGHWGKKLDLSQVPMRP